jgi:hypothetical protein
MIHARNLVCGYRLRLWLAGAFAILAIVQTSVSQTNWLGFAPPGRFDYTHTNNPVNPYTGLPGLSTLPYFPEHPYTIQYLGGIQYWQQYSTIYLSVISNYLYTAHWWHATNSLDRQEFWGWHQYSNAYWDSFVSGVALTNFFANTTNWYPQLVTNSALLLSNAYVQTAKIDANALNSSTNWDYFRVNYIQPAFSNWFPMLTNNTVEMTNLLSRIALSFTNLGSLSSITNLNFSGLTNVANVASNIGALSYLSELTNVTGLWPTFNAINTNVGAINSMTKLEMMPLFTIVSSNIQGLKADQDKQVSYITVNSNFLKQIADKSWSVSNYVSVTNINNNTNSNFNTNIVTVTNTGGVFDPASSNNLKYVRDSLASEYAKHVPMTNANDVMLFATNVTAFTNAARDLTVNLTNALTAINRNGTPEGSLSNLNVVISARGGMYEHTFNFNALAVPLVAQWAPRIRAFVTWAIAIGFFYFLLGEAKENWATIAANQQTRVLDLQGWGFSTNWVVAVVVVPAVIALALAYPAMVIFQTSAGGLLGFQTTDWVLDPIVSLASGFPSAQAYLLMVDSFIPVGLVVYTAVGSLVLGWIMHLAVVVATALIKAIPG